MKDLEKRKIRKHVEIDITKKKIVASFLGI
jgi:hypothetical protein